MDKYPQEFLTDDIDAIKQLFKEGLDVNAKGDYLPVWGGETTFLHVAAFNNLPKVAKLLIEKGADINAQDSQGCTSLHIAAYQDSCEAAEIIIDAGADLNAQMFASWSNGCEGRTTPLHCACQDGGFGVIQSFGAVQLLLEAGANVEAQDERAATPLHLAVWTSLKATKLLIEYGANVNAVNDSGDTPICCIRRDDSKIGRIDGLEAAKLLISNGADIHSPTDKYGDAPLHRATNSTFIELIKLLIEKGADINAQNNEGWSPLHNAVNNRIIDAVKVLIKHGANVNAKDGMGLTPLWGCVISCSLLDENENPDVCIKIAQLLLKAGADTKAKDEYGETIFSEGGINFEDNPVTDYLLKHEIRKIITQSIQKES